MSNSLGSIYATTKTNQPNGLQKYIMLDSQNVEVSGNFFINGTNSRMPAEIENSLKNYLPLTYGITDPNTSTLFEKFEDLSLNLLTSNHDASFNNVDICGNLSIANDLIVNEDLSVNGHIDANDASFNNVTVNGNVTGTNLNIADWNTAFQRPAPQTNNPTFTGTLTTGGVAANSIGANPSIGYIYITLNDQVGGNKLRFGGGGTVSYLCLKSDELNMKRYSNGGAASLYLNRNGGNVYYGNPPQQMSDDRVKFNETNIENGLEVIRRLSPEKYIKKLPTQTEGIEEAGFIAQEVLEINDLSFAVTHPDKEFVEGDPNTRYYAVDYTSIFTYGLAGLKELDAIVQAQAATIANLEQRLAALEA